MHKLETVLFKTISTHHSALANRDWAFDNTKHIKQTVKGNFKAVISRLVYRLQKQAEFFENMIVTGFSQHDCFAAYML